MPEELPLIELLSTGSHYFLPSVSIDNVIFGFHENELSVLLLQLKSNKKWALPGGHIFKNEEMDDAAARILKDRTGLSNLFLQQFQVFGSTKRTREEVLKELLKMVGVTISDESWILQRFISIGYYALVRYDKVNPHPDELSVQCTWRNLQTLPELIFDHKEIIEKALQTMRLQLNYQPIGYNLLPREFTLKNLQVIYETLLGRKLDRSNFNRKILSYGVLDRKEKHYSGAAHKAPFLYSFNKKTYFKALENGLNKDF